MNSTGIIMIVVAIFVVIILLSGFAYKNEKNIQGGKRRVKYLN